MKFTKTVLLNGANLIVVPEPSLKSATATVWVKAGSRNESKDVRGVSHFLEHMVFKGSKKRPSTKAISQAVDAFGGEFNAGTSKEWTQFYIKARSEKLETALDVLSDMILNPLLRPKDIETEKNVILEEMAMYEDMPMRKINDNYEALMYRGNPLGEDIIGTAETVKSLRRSDIKRYIETYYVASNFLITVAGGVEPDVVEKLANKYFSNLKRGKTASFEQFKNYQTKMRVYLQAKQSEQAHIVLGFPANKWGADERYIEAVLATILGKGMSSRLFLQVREKRGLAYYVSTSDERFFDAGYFAVKAGVKPGRVREAIKVIIDELEKLKSKSEEISAEELTKAKEFIKGHLALDLEDTSGINSFVGLEQIYTGKTRTANEVYRKIDKVTRQDVYRLADKFFDINKAYLAVIGPYKSEAEFEKLLL